MNGSRAKKLSFKKDGDYLLNSGIETGIFLSDTLAVLSSLKGGVIFINPLKSEIVKIINYQSGLPDNEVYAWPPMIIMVSGLLIVRDLPE